MFRNTDIIERHRTGSSLAEACVAARVPAASLVHAAAYPKALGGALAVETAAFSDPGRR